MSATIGEDGYYQRSRPAGVKSTREVQDFHTNDDMDAGKNAHHHSLGPSASQASPGSHSHDGTDSRQLMAGITITGSKGGNVALANLISALALALGFTDSTT